MNYKAIVMNTHFSFMNVANLFSIISIMVNLVVLSSGEYGGGVDQ